MRSAHVPADDAVPRDILRRVAHCPADCACVDVHLAGDLSVGHDVARRDCADDIVNCIEVAGHRATRASYRISCPPVTLIAWPVM